MELCELCGITNEEVKIYDAIQNGRMITICQRCSIIENITTIIKPNPEQLKDSERPVGILKRMRRLSGIEEPKQSLFVQDKLKELDENPGLELPEKESLNLVEHFHWIILKERRRKGFTHEKLARTIGESIVGLQMIEKGKLPESPEILLAKLEQFFQIKLRNLPEKKSMEPVLFDEEGNEIDIIPEEEEMIFKEDEEEEKSYFFEDETRDIELKNVDQSRVKISDLQRIHKKKIEVTKKEQIEEQQKIEERRRILEALREKDRIKQEEIKKQEEFEKQKDNQERQNIILEKQKELEKIKQKDNQEIDRHFGGTELLSNKSKEEPGSIKDKEFNDKEFDDKLF